MRMQCNWTNEDWTHYDQLLKDLRPFESTEEADVAKAWAQSQVEDGFHLDLADLDIGPMCQCCGATINSDDKTGICDPCKTDPWRSVD